MDVKYCSEADGGLEVEDNSDGGQGGPTKCKATGLGGGTAGSMQRPKSAKGELEKGGTRDESSS